MAIDSQRQEVVGVSDSDELTQMIRYQNAYNASSRYINTINSMLDTLYQHYDVTGKGAKICLHSFSD